MKMATVLAAALLGSVSSSACSGDAQATMDAQRIEGQYGVAGAHSDIVTTPDGPIRGTLVPITLANGREGQLFIPQKRAREPHAVYLRDDQGLHPMELKDNVRRDELTGGPGIVERRAEPQHTNKRSWEKEALIIGGSAGAGTAIGALAGGKKGAGVGAAAGGVGGLIYDLITRNKE
jgi:hypothetical protein